MLGTNFEIIHVSQSIKIIINFSHRIKYLCEILGTRRRYYWNGHREQRKIHNVLLEQNGHDYLEFKRRYIGPN